METRINESHLEFRGQKLLSKKQAAAEFGVTYRTIERWYNLNYIDYIRVGGRVFISYAEIYRIRDRFLDGKPNGYHMESKIQTIDDIRQRQQSHSFGARR
ncbi:hypothetical protein KML24007_04300 [Alistipes indistinctus]|uniref:hypothetical protein n=1 Tax=Alistipes indistinctus TaxID=626932 RepID=UPI0036F3CE39